MRVVSVLFTSALLFACRPTGGQTDHAVAPPKKAAAPEVPAACQRPGLPQKGLRTTQAMVHTATKKIPLRIELALNNRQREVGMMCRTHAPDDAGMLFVFAREGRRSFWMKNTLIPLDIVFLDKSRRVINVQENATPLTRTSRPSLAPAQYVLEVRGGWAKEYGLAAGDTVSFDLESPPG